MNGYLAGIQRVFSTYWGYDINIFEGPVFNCPEYGLVSVIDNKFSVQQAVGQVITSHNTLSKNDLKTLFASEHLSRSTLMGFQIRLIFGVALITAMRPSALVTLTTSQFRKIKVENQLVWSVRGVIGSRIGASKVNRGGRNSVRDKPTEICICNKDYLGEKQNLFQDIDGYMVARSTLECGTNRFFLAANPKEKTLSTFFKRQHLGRNSFLRIVKEVCQASGVVGSGLAEGMTAHGLRGTVVTMLFEDGCGDASVALRRGHRDLRFLKSYHILRGNLGEKTRIHFRPCIQEAKGRDYISTTRWKGKC